MWWIIGIAIVATLVVYCACVAASNADDAEEKWWEKHGKELMKKMGLKNDED